MKDYRNFVDGLPCVIKSSAPILILATSRQWTYLRSAGQIPIPVRKRPPDPYLSPLVG